MKEFKNEIELLNEVARLDCEKFDKIPGFLNEEERVSVFKTISIVSKNMIYWNSFKKRFQIDNVGFYYK